MAEQSPDQTIVIDNFTGSLTRVLNGELNSGLAKFDTSWGYNPFVKPQNLTWFKDKGAVTVPSGIVVASVSRVESGVTMTYSITDTGHFIQLQGEGGAVTDFHTLATGSPTFTYGASIKLYNGKFWITNDKGLSTINDDGVYGTETQVGTWDSSHFVQNTYHPLQTFIGKLFVGNTTDGTNPNIGTIDTTNTITTYATFTPTLPVGIYVRDMDVTPDFSYLILSCSGANSELIAPGNDSGAASSDSLIIQWNGSDQGVTAGVNLPNFIITALNNFGNFKYGFMYDAIGASVYDGTSKILTIRNGKSPFPNANTSSGNFVTWAAPYTYYNLDSQTYVVKGAIYYYGSLDNDLGVGLWRVLEISSVIGGQVCQVPWFTFTNNRYISIDNTATLTVNHGTNLFSYIDYTGSGGSTNKLHAIFYIAPPDDAFWSGAVAGVYETQTQIFSKRQTIKQIRVYCEPTASNQGFNIDLIGSDGKKMTNGSFSYSFSAGSDPTTLKGSFERINFNPSQLNFYALGVRITNTGSSNMTIKKIELDITTAGQ